MEKQECSPCSPAKDGWGSRLMVKEIAGQILSLSALADIPLENSNRVHSSKKRETEKST